VEPKLATAVVVVVTAAKGLENNRDAATSENEGTADDVVVHGDPNILSDGSIIPFYKLKKKIHHNKQLEYLIALVMRYD